LGGHTDKTEGDEEVGVDVHDDIWSPAVYSGVIGREVWRWYEVELESGVLTTVVELWNEGGRSKAKLLGGVGRGGTQYLYLSKPGTGPITCLARVISEDHALRSWAVPIRRSWRPSALIRLTTTDTGVRG